jgi:hypothetical protein
MKKIILLAALVAFGVTTSNAQTAKKVATKPAAKTETPKVDGPGMLFENETIDYGTIPANSDGKREFVFVNNGTKPLIIESTQGSCGCTVPSKPEKPIQPGERGVIGVKYDTSRAGQSFQKTVTVKSNAVGQENKVLTIKGNVLPAETKVEPTKS